jgi:hypothetical protein
VADPAAPVSSAIKSAHNAHPHSTDGEDIDPPGCPGYQANRSAMPARRSGIKINISQAESHQFNHAQARESGEDH